MPKLNKNLIIGISIAIVLILGGNYWLGFFAKSQAS